MTYSFELNEVDPAEIGKSVGEMAKDFMLEDIEDIMTIRACEKAEAEYEANPVTYNLDEVEKMLEIA